MASQTLIENTNYQSNNNDLIVCIICDRARDNFLLVNHFFNDNSFDYTDEDSKNLKSFWFPFTKILPNETTIKTIERLINVN